MRTWMLGLLVACGGHAAPGAPDAGIDAPYDVGPTGPISVYAAYPGAASPDHPMPGAIVVFCDAAGHVVDREITGGDGVVIGMAPADAMVTVLPPPGTSGARYTWVGAAPGDFLYTGEVPPIVSPNGDNRAVVLPRDGDDVSVYEFTIPGFIADNDMPAAAGPITAQGWLAGAPVMAADAVADATHATGHHRFIVAHDVTVGPTPLDLTAATWTDPIVLDYSIVNMPADLRWLSAYYEQLAGVQLLWEASIYVSSAGDVTEHLDTPGSLGDGTALAMYFQRGYGAQTNFWAVTFNGAPSPVDLAAIALPSASAVAVQPDGAATWSVDGDPAHALATELAIVSQTGETWNVLLPSDRRSFELPALPADLPAFAPATSAKILFLGGNDPGGYQAARTDAAAFDSGRWGQVLPTTPGVYHIATY